MPFPGHIEALIAAVDEQHGFSIRGFLEWLVREHDIEDDDPLGGKPQPHGEPYDPEARGWAWRKAPDGGTLIPIDESRTAEEATLQPSSKEEAAAAVLLHCVFATQEPEAAEVLGRLQKRQRELEKLSKGVAQDLELAANWFRRMDATSEDVPLSDLGERVSESHTALLQLHQLFENTIRSRLPSWAGLPRGPYRSEDTLLLVLTRMCFAAGFDEQEIAEFFDDHSGERRRANARDRIGRKRDYKRHRPGE